MGRAGGHKMLTELFNDFRREDAGGECSAEYGVELLVEAADAHLVEVPVRIDE